MPFAWNADLHLERPAFLQLAIDVAALQQGWPITLPEGSLARLRQPSLISFLSASISRCRP